MNWNRFEQPAAKDLFLLLMKFINTRKSKSHYNVCPKKEHTDPTIHINNWEIAKYKGRGQQQKTNMVICTKYLNIAIRQ